MKAVDDLIEKLAIHISEVISSGKERDHEVTEKTNALAALMSARALPHTPYEENIEDGVMRAVSSAIRGTDEAVQG